MLQQETGEVKESEYGSVEFETITDDEEITIPSHTLSVMNRLCQIHNEKTVLLPLSGIREKMDKLVQVW